MNTTTSKSTLDPVELVRQLDPVEIRNRLEGLDRERQALIVLLRAADRANPLGTHQHQKTNHK